MSEPLDVGAIRDELGRANPAADFRYAVRRARDLCDVIEQMAAALDLVIREDFEAGDVLRVCRDARALITGLEISDDRITALKSAARVIEE